MKGTIFRAMILPADDPKAHDHDGRSLGDDWPVVHVPPTGDGDTEFDQWLTTDRVHASDYGFVVPGTQAGLARLLAVAVNQLWKNCPTAGGWSALVHSCDADGVLDGTDWPGWELRPPGHDNPNEE